MHWNSQGIADSEKARVANHRIKNIQYQIYSSRLNSQNSKVNHFCSVLDQIQSRVASSLLQKHIFMND